MIARHILDELELYAVVEKHAEDKKATGGPKTHGMVVTRAVRGQLLYHMVMEMKLFLLDRALW